jgi:hypothetical protein
MCQSKVFIKPSLRRTTRLVGTGLLLAFTLVGAKASAENVKEREARKACLTGNPKLGIELLSDLFVDTKNPIYIYNQGRCLEQNARYSEAIVRFQEFLRAATNPNEEDKAAAQKHIAECQALLAKEQPAQGSGAGVETGTLPYQEPPAVEKPLGTPTSPGGGRSGLKIAGIATASIGGALLVGGLIFNLKVNSMASDLNSFGNYSDDKESRRKTYETLGWVGYGVGAACLVTGTVLFLLGRSSSSSSWGQPAMTISPTVGQNQAGAALTGAF